MWIHFALNDFELFFSSCSCSILQKIKKYYDNKLNNEKIMFEMKAKYEKENININ